MEEEESNIEQQDDPDKFKLPLNFVEDVYPCDYIRKIYKKSIILFDKMGNRVSEFLNSAKYSIIPPYIDIPILDSYQMFLESFNPVQRNEIYAPPPEVQDYINYLTSMIPNKTCFPIAISWPPAIPRVVSQIEPISAILIQMLYEAEDPTNLLRLLLKGFFPKIWTSKTCGDDPVILAISSCSYKGHPGFWALITREPLHFYLIGFDKNGKERVVASSPITNITKSKDLKYVIPKNKDKKILKFRPTDPKMIEIWPHIFEKKESDQNLPEAQAEYIIREVPFVFYLTEKAQFYPSIFYNSFYRALRSNDMVLLRAAILMNPNYEVMNSLLTLYLHFRKVHLFFGTVIGQLFEEDEVNPMTIYSKDGFYRKFTRALFNRFSYTYIDEFLRPLAKFINRHEELNEQLFFNIVKHIMNSCNYIPYPVRHVASIIRLYSATKFNSRGFTFLMLGGFIGHEFICPILANPEKYIDYFENDKPELFSEISRLLQYVFKGALLPNEYESWNKRLVQNYFPELEDWLFSLGDLPEEKPTYYPPRQREVLPALKTVMDFLLVKDSQIRPTFEDAISSIATYTPQISWNFAGCLASFFRFCYDYGIDHSLRKKVKIVDQEPIEDAYIPDLHEPLPDTVDPEKEWDRMVAAKKAAKEAAKERRAAREAEKERRRAKHTRPPVLKLPKRPADARHNPIAKSDEEESSSSFTIEPKRESYVAPRDTLLPTVTDTGTYTYTEDEELARKERRREEDEEWTFTEIPDSGADGGKRRQRVNRRQYMEDIGTFTFVEVDDAAAEGGKRRVKKWRPHRDESMTYTEVTDTDGGRHRERVTREDRDLSDSWTEGEVMDSGADGGFRKKRMRRSEKERLLAKRCDDQATYTYTYITDSSFEGGHRRQKMKRVHKTDGFTWTYATETANGSDEAVEGNGKTEIIDSVPTKSEYTYVTVTDQAPTNSEYTYVTEYTYSTARAPSQSFPTQGEVRADPDDENSYTESRTKTKTRTEYSTRNTTNTQSSQRETSAEIPEKRKQTRTETEYSTGYTKPNTKSETHSGVGENPEKSRPKRHSNSREKGKCEKLPPVPREVIKGKVPIAEVTQSLTATTEQSRTTTDTSDADLKRAIRGVAETPIETRPKDEEKPKKRRKVTSKRVIAVGSGIDLSAIDAKNIKIVKVPKH